MPRGAFASAPVRDPHGGSAAEASARETGGPEQGGVGRAGPFLALFLVLLALSFLRFLDTAGRVQMFKAGHWVFDYSLGLIRRGLVGTVTEAMFGAAANGYPFIERVSILLCLACFLAYSAFAAWIASARPDSPASLGVALAGPLLAPALPLFAFDLGRFDQVNFLLLLLALIVVAKGPPRIMPVVLAVVGSVALLVHEGFLVVQFPMLAGLALLRLRAGEGIAAGPAFRLLALPCVLVLAVFALLWWQGGAPADPAAWREHWEQQAAAAIPLAVKNDVLHVHGRGIMDNLRWTLAHLTAQRLAHAGLVLLCAAYSGGMLWFGLCRQALPAAPRWLAGLVFVSFLSPLAMVPIGLDTLRWVGAVVLNLVLGLLVLLHMAPEGWRPDSRFLHIGRRPGGGWDGVALARATALALALALLLSPRSMGVVGMRPLPEPVACMLGTPYIEGSMPRHPELCPYP